MNSVEILNQKYDALVKKKSDINEHLSTLSKYASKCMSVTEFGVRSCVSSYAFLQGLMNNKSNTKKLTSVDINLHKNLRRIEKLTNNLNIDYKFIHDSDLNIEIDNTDILFIDSWHCYGQLIRELNLHHNNVNRYIILHDTTVDGIYSENIRMNNTYNKNNTNFTEYEFNVGLWPAVEHFLQENSDWTITKKYTNNNGLTILKKNN